MEVPDWKQYRAPQNTHPISSRKRPKVWNSGRKQRNTSLSPSRGRAIVQDVTHYDDPDILAEISKGLGEPMVGIGVSELPEGERLAVRGW